LIRSIILILAFVELQQDCYALRAV